MTFLHFPIGLVQRYSCTPSMILDAQMYSYTPSNNSKNKKSWEFPFVFIRKSMMLDAQSYSYTKRIKGLNHMMIH